MEILFQIKKYQFPAKRLAVLYILLFKLFIDDLFVHAFLLLLLYLYKLKIYVETLCFIDFSLIPYKSIVRKNDYRDTLLFNMD